MKINRSSHISGDPFISHMRISYEDSIRKQTEEFWRNTIASEITEKFRYVQSLDHVTNFIINNRTKI